MYKNFNIKELVEFTKTLKLLYVEDNEDAREALLSLLENFFDDIVVAVDGEDAIEKFKNGHFDLIISDIRMPKMNGIEFSKKVRKINMEIPIIIATAHKESGYIIECIEVGVNAYLLKPINFKHLQKVIKQTCEKIYYKRKNDEYEKGLEELVKIRTKELENSKYQFKEMANRDPLTNLYNRRYFNDVSEVLFSISKREEKPFALLMIDIDRFKNINDEYGHISGDQVLESIAKIFFSHIRSSDIAIRFGGEEFLILLPNTDNDGACALAEKIRIAIQNNEVVIDAHQKEIIKITVSIGIASCECHEDINIDDLLKRADKALYDAKRTGRNKSVFYQKKIC